MAFLPVWSRYRTYAIGAAVALLALGLQWGVRPWTGDRVPFLFFLPALTFAAVSLGRGPALIVLVCGLVDSLVSVPPTGWGLHRPEDASALLLFAAMGLGLVLYGGRLRYSTGRAATAEERLQLAQEGTGIGVFDLDFQAGTAFVSPSLCELLNQPVLAGPIPLDEWLGRLDPAHVEESRRTLQTMADRGELRYEREQRIDLPSGGFRWLLSRVRIDVANDGALARASGATMDITARKQVDELLEQARRELRQQVDDLQRLHALSQRLVARIDGLREPMQTLLDLVVDLHGARHGVVHLRTPAGGLEVAAMIGFEAGGIAALDSLSPDRRPWERAVCDGQRTVLDDLPADGSTGLSVRGLHAVPLVGGNREVLGVITVFFDAPHTVDEREMRLSDICATTGIAVIERERARAQADENRQRFEVALASSTVAFTILAPVRDEHGRVVDFRWTYLNERAASALGSNADDMVGRRVTELVPSAWSAPGLLEAYAAVAERGEVRELETQSTRLAALWHQVIASPLEGQVAVWFADISERKRHEHSLREADRRKDEFLATLAHELRNPLAPIRQAVLIARSPRVTEQQKRWSHDVIERQVRSMALLLDDLLDVSRITRGRLSLRPAPVGLSTVIDSAVEIATPHIEAKGHQLTVHLPGPPCQLMVDALRLSQVLGNLLTNAAKYTDAGGEIHLSASVGAAGCTVRVEDNGIGLSAEQLEHVFGMFTQVPGALGRSQEGLGIGLALARGLVELHGGRIRADSPGIGLGSCFTVELPADCVLPSPVEPLLPEGAALPRATSAPGLRILVADDNVDAAESLAELLRVDGHELHVVHDGQAALAAFERLQPQAALFDLGMPRLSGLEVARAVRRLPCGERAVLIAVTGWGQERDRQEALAAGFDHHTTKPVDPAHLQALIAIRRAATSVDRVGTSPLAGSPKATP